MPPPSREFVIDLPIRVAEDREYSLDPIQLEEEVIGLFDQYRNRLFRYVLSLGLSTFDGEEIIQDVFLAVFRHLQSGRPRTNLRGWIFRVAHNLALKRLQANQKARNTVELTDSIAQVSTDPDPNPEEQIMDRQQHNQLRAVVRGLPRRDQCCLYLRAEGLRYREISEVLSMSLGAVSISLTKSFARLGRAAGVWTDV